MMNIRTDKYWLTFMGLGSLHIERLAQDGIYDVEVIAARGHDRLLEGEDHSGCLMRGWLNDGMAIIDIDWQTENVDGWPKSVSV